jgi:electron transport complex protein RnfC
MDVGCAVIGPAACLAVYRGVACQLPTTGRVVTVAGSESENSGNFYVPFGVSCKELAGKYAELVSHNGPMVGLACDEDAVVSPSTDLLLAMRPGPPKPPTPCIRCGWCTDHCPARLNVAALNDAFELAELSRARRLAAPACVECGVCSYVCPARLPLSQRVRQLKWTLLGIERAMPLFRKQRRRD